MESAQPFLRTKNLHLQVGQRDLIRSLDWTVKAGECWCVIGRNGAGKSSLLRCIAGLRDYQGGEIALDGQPLAAWKLESLAKKRAFLPQGRVDAFAYRAIETVLSARHPYHDTHYWESADDQAIALNAMQLLDVENLAQRDVRSLSGGERQRVAIAALLAQEATLILLDEPASALDLAHQVSVMHILASACKDKKQAVVMVSHDLNLSYGVASHVLLMMPDGGYLLGSKDEVMTTENLSLCLGHPIERFSHAEQTVFLPSIK